MKIGYWNIPVKKVRALLEPFGITIEELNWEDFLKSVELNAAYDEAWRSKSKENIINSVLESMVEYGNATIGGKDGADLEKKELIEKKREVLKAWCATSLQEELLDRLYIEKETFNQDEFECQLLAYTATNYKDNPKDRFTEYGIVSGIIYGMCDDQLIYKVHQPPTTCEKESLMFKKLLRYVSEREVREELERRMIAFSHFNLEKLPLYHKHYYYLGIRGILDKMDEEHVLTKRQVSRWTQEEKVREERLRIWKEIANWDIYGFSREGRYSLAKEMGWPNYFEDEMGMPFFGLVDAWDNHKFMLERNGGDIQKPQSTNRAVEKEQHRKTSSPAIPEEHSVETKEQTKNQIENHEEELAKRRSFVKRVVIVMVGYIVFATLVVLFLDILISNTEQGSSEMPTEEIEYTVDPELRENILNSVLNPEKDTISVDSGY